MWGMYTEDNSFGTHEFIGLCRLIGAEPYLAGNVGSGTPQELRDWMEYCNYPKGSTLSDERAANGRAEPFSVKYWGVGNENWGCGGNMTGEEYAADVPALRDLSAAAFGGTQPFLIACGPNGNDNEWTQKFWRQHARRPSERLRHALLLQRAWQYCHATSPWMTCGSSSAASANLETAILEQRALMDTLATPNARPWACCWTSGACGTGWTRRKRRSTGGSSSRSRCAARWRRRWA